MRRITRLPLAAEMANQLAERQRRFDRDREQGAADAAGTWKRARQTKSLTAILETLRAMAGQRARCMYCGDSHGTDIEHWRPKVRYPEHLFDWLNLLLCCPECGRWKGDRFPLADDGTPLLLDPTMDDPWQHLEFDPLTGLLSPRFHPGAGAFDGRGEATIDVLHFRDRDAAQIGYRRTWKRLAKTAEAWMERPSQDPDDLPRRLREEDEHGLLAWCLGRGSSDEPFLSLKTQHPEAFLAVTVAMRVLPGRS